MTQIIPKKAYVIRTIDDRPVMFDESLQKLPDGTYNEMTFVDKAQAVYILLRYQAMVSLSGDLTEFKLVEKDINPEEIDWVMTDEDIRRKLNSN